MWLILIWSAALVLTAVLYFRQKYSYFRKRGVKNETVVPPFGSMHKFILRQQHFSDHLIYLYKKFRGERFVGRYEFTKPVLMIQDLELIKKVTIKDFEHFLDHQTFVDSESDPLFGRNLVSLKGQEWKDMRSTLSPAFTSSKMRHMMPFMVEAGDQMIRSLKKTIKESSNDYLDLDVKDLTTRFANDVIASCAFGLKVDSHADRENEFYIEGLTASTLKFRQLLMFIVSSSLPWLAKRLHLKLFSGGTQQFFRHLVTQTMQTREKQNIIRPDMIHLLMEAKKGKLSYDDKTVDADAGFATVEESSVGKKVTNRDWSDDDLIAQAVLFFIAGFETVSSAMSFMLYELAVNPEVQDKLVHEIKEMDATTGGKFDYNSIQKMPYMDMVVSEVLRKWPPAIALDRLCIKNYNLGKPNDKASEDYIIHAGQAVQIPTWAIHHDPQYFPDPEKFDPERFSEENKHKIDPFAYSPFGLGPRNCIGSRFALCEMKILAYQLLLHMELMPGPKTRIPAELDRNTFNIRIKGGHWLRFKARRNVNKKQAIE